MALPAARTAGRSKASSFHYLGIRRGERNRYAFNFQRVELAKRWSASGKVRSGFPEKTRD
jgi:hypothetical protein